MNKNKKSIILIFLALALVLVFAGCAGDGILKEAKLTITANPNPAPYNEEIERWKFDLEIRERNGVGVTLNSMKINFYNENNDITTSQIENVDTIIEWFKTDYIAASSKISSPVRVTLGKANYTIFAFEGIDDNSNPVEAAVRIDYLPK